MNIKKPLVSIVVVNYNAKRFLKDCFSSLSNLNYPKNKLELIMVDNGSTDSSVNFVKKKFPKVKIIENDVNNYCKALNLGIKLSKGQYIASVNNDTEADADWLIELLKEITSDRLIAAVGSKMVSFEGRIQSAGHQEYPNFYWGDRGYRQQDNGQYDTAEEVFSTCGGATLYRKEYLYQVGLFDEDFNMYLEDVDISIRFKNNGWKIKYVPTGIIYHHLHGTVKEDLANFYSERNRLLLLAKHYSQKLGDNIWGKGYFAASNNVEKRNRDIWEILPLIFRKLLKHHEREKVNKLLPSIFENVKKFLNIEKDHLVWALEDRTNELGLYQKTLAQKDQQINIHLQQIRDKDQQLNLKDMELAQRQKDLQQKDQQINIHLQQKDQQINIHLQQIRDKDQQLNLKDMELAQRQKDLQQKDQQTNIHLQQIRDKDQQLNLKDMELAQRQKDLQQKDQQIRDKDQQLNLKDMELAQRQKDLQQKDQQINIHLQQKDQQINIHLQQIRDKDQQLNLKDMELAQRQKDLQQKDQQIQQLHNEIDKIYNSETYRFMARPFWKVCEILKPLLRPFNSFRHLLIRKNDKLCLGMFSAESNRAIYGTLNHYFLKVTNNTPQYQTVKVVIDIYSYDDFSSNRHYGYFAKELISRANSSTEIKIDYNWLDTARFHLNGSSSKPDDFWKGDLDTAQLYSVKAVLHYQQHGSIDKLEILQRLKK